MNKLCNCGEVIYTFPGKDYAICPKCKEVMYVIDNENNGEENERRPSKPRSEGQDTMGFHR